MKSIKRDIRIFNIKYLVYFSTISITNLACSFSLYKDTIFLRNISNFYVFLTFILKIVKL